MSARINIGKAGLVLGAVIGGWHLMRDGGSRSCQNNADIRSPVDRRGRLAAPICSQPHHRSR